MPTSPALLSRLAVAAVAVVAGGVGGWLIGRRRPHAAGRAVLRDASSAGVRTPLAPGDRDLSRAQLEADLEAMRVLLRDYIADRETTEDALRAEEARYRLLFEHNPRPVWVYDTETLRFLAVNEAAIRRYGWSRDEFLAMRVSDLHPPGELPAIQDAVARLGTADRESEWRHRTRDGRVRDVVLLSHAIRFGGRDARLVLVEDVTERRRADAATQEMARR